ncbi:MAG: hypothetical protein GTO02_12840 [Candidatus Dadabacteria bacterium]|nr:hypothetical protein [Candidatus Dadabacteria bacterium]NIQ15236.1 hypothetical protein [Candidatus Dadabacteria bacterium]
MPDKEEKTNNDPSPADDNYVNSINMAFNMGVATNQSTGHTKSVVDIAAEMGEQIYQNFAKGYGEEVPEDFLRANTEYFLQIALLGYIIPTVCAFEPDFKDRLFDLIFKKAEHDRKKAEQASGGSRIIT